MSDPQIQALIEIDSDFQPVLDEFGPPPSRSRPPGFETLLRIIVGQQVSTASAAAIWRRLDKKLKRIDPDSILKLGFGGLSNVGFSGPKVRYAQALAEAVKDGELVFDHLARLDDEAAIAALTRIKGIGRWTAEIYLLAALDREDIWPGADVALITAAQELKGLPNRPKAEELRDLAEMWRPYRSVAARMLWHYYGGKRGRIAQPLGSEA